MKLSWTDANNAAYWLQHPLNTTELRTLSRCRGKWWAPPRHLRFVVAYLICLDCLDCRDNEGGQVRITEKGVNALDFFAPNIPKEGS